MMTAVTCVLTLVWPSMLLTYHADALFVGPIDQPLGGIFGMWESINSILYFSLASFSLVMLDDFESSSVLFSISQGPGGGLLYGQE